MSVDIMFRIRFNDANIFLYFVREEFRAMCVSVAIILSLSLVLVIWYFNLQSEFSVENINIRILNNIPISEWSSPLFSNFTHSIREAVLSMLSFIGIATIIVLSILFSVWSLISIIWEFVTWKIFLPRKQRIWDYLELEDTYERKVMWPVIVFSVIIVLASSFWFMDVPLEAYTVDYVSSAFATLILCLAVFVLGMDYFLRIRLGVISRTLELLPSRSIYHRVLLRRFFAIILTFSMLILGIAAIGNILMPMADKSITENTDKISIASLEFKHEAELEGVNIDIVHQVLSNVEDIQSRLYVIPSEVFIFWQDSINKVYWSFAVILFMALLTLYLFPLFHLEIRVVPIAVTAILLLLIGMELVLRESMPFIFKLGNQGPTALIVTIGISVVFSQIIITVMKLVFRRKGLVYTEGVSFYGNIKTQYVHRYHCPYMKRKTKNNSVEFGDVDEAQENGYKLCSYCLSELKYKSLN